MFQQLRRLQLFERQHLPQLEFPIDSRIISEIGYHEERGRPLTGKGLLLLEIGASATIRRRLHRLMRLGLIHKRPVAHDGRIYHLEVDPTVRRTYAKYLNLISRR